MQLKVPERSNKVLVKRIAELEAELKQLTETTAQQSDVNEGSQLERLEAFFDFSSVGVVRANIDGRFLDANETFAEMIGYSKEELQSARWDQITPPEFRHVDEDAITQILTTGKAMPFEKEYIHKDGHRVPVLLAVHSVEGNGRDCFCLAVDLTEQKSKEKALRESEAQFRLLADAIPQIVYITGEDQNVEYFNKRWYEVTGLERASFPGDSWRQIVHPDDIEYADKSFHRAVANQEQLDIEVRQRTVDGTYRWTLVRALPIKDATGKVTKWLGTSTDIDAQKRAVDELHASEERFRTLADSIPQIVWTADPAGQIDFFNHRYFEYTGLTIEQSLNNGWQLLVHPDDLPIYLKEWQAALKTGNTYEREFRLKRALGLLKGTGSPYRKHLARAVALRGEDGSIIKWFATWTEIEHDKRE